jgi:hypothetical protein
MLDPGRLDLTTQMKYVESLRRIRNVGAGTIGRRGLEEIWGALHFVVKKGKRTKMELISRVGIVVYSARPLTLSCSVQGGLLCTEPSHLHCPVLYKGGLLCTAPGHLHCPVLYKGRLLCTAPGHLHCPVLYTGGLLCTAPGHLHCPVLYKGGFRN